MRKANIALEITCFNTWVNLSGNDDDKDEVNIYWLIWFLKIEKCTIFCILFMSLCRSHLFIYNIKNFKVLYYEDNSEVTLRK